MSNSNNRFLDFAKDSTRGRDAFWYRVVWLLGTLQAFILRRYIKQHVWRSFDGTVHTPKTMGDKHLVNTILLIERHNEHEDNPVYDAMRLEGERRYLSFQIEKTRKRYARYTD